MSIATACLAVVLPYSFIQSYTKPELHKLYAETCTKYGYKWSKPESEAYVKIVWKESTGNPNCTTSRSSSAGLYGFLRGTRKAYKVSLRDPHVVQSRAFIQYCIRRYGSMTKALAHHRKKGYY